MDKLTDGPKFLTAFQQGYKRFRPLCLLRFVGDCSRVGEYRLVAASYAYKKDDDAEQSRSFEKATPS